MTPHGWRGRAAARGVLYLPSSYMPGTVVPAIVGSILLLLVGFLALLAERRSTVARWFALLNICLAATSALAAISNSSPAHALMFARLASIAATLALLSLHLQLATLA